MQFIDQITTGSQCHRDHMRTLLGMAKYHCQIRIVGVDALTELVDLRIFGRIDDHLLDGIQCDVVALDLHILRCMHVLR